MTDAFTHLHVHSQYSLLEGAIRVTDLCKRTGALGMKSAALTDHSNMHGAVDFYKKSKEAGLHALLGCELGFTFPNDRKADGKVRAHHLVLLARDAVGYKNLIALVSHAWRPAVDGVHPHASLEQLAAHSKGLVVLSGCLGGLIPQAVLQYSPDAGRTLLGTLRDACEPGSLFVELQDHGFTEQSVLNELLVGFSRDLELPTVATNDAHFLTREDAIAHKLLGCIASGSTLSEADRQHHGSTEMFLKSPAEMVERFRHNPEAIANTQRVVEMCGKVDPTQKPMLPRYRDDEGKIVENEAECFTVLARAGLVKRFAKMKAGFNEQVYRDRLELEIRVIIEMGFPGYFLIVQDFINWAKNHRVPVGPGRGSGAGSLVAYALGITDLDPLPYNLLFERFLNPERVSMPDFDVDFCMLKRGEVIEYVRNKYGQDSVGQIATFQLLKSKSVVRDVGRALGVPYAETDAIAKLIPEPVLGKSATIDEAMEKEPRLKAMYDDSPQTRQLLDLAKKLENLNRHAGMHAAGIVISEGPLWETVPIFRGANGELVTQYAKDEVEAAGLVKFDFLGLTTLTVLDTAIQLIDKRPDRKAETAAGRPFDLTELPLDDKATYELLRSGETTGVFQLESSGMQKLFRDLKPDRFEDIVAAVALYRPGPLGSGMVTSFVERKNGRQKVEYPHPDLADLLQDTYGVVTYQEQVMMVARTMGGYSLGGADLLRRAMGKKKAEEMAKHLGIFLEGAKKKGYDPALAEDVFKLLEYFAGYGFNKSHSAAYALITYQTAYLKTHFPVEFMCGTLTSDLGKIEKVVGTIAECRAMGMAVLPPDVNESVRQFSVVYTLDGTSPRKTRTALERDACRPRLRFGLGGVKGVGDSAVEAIIEAREAGGPFVDLFDFCARVNVSKVNRGALEALVQAGAFDDTLKRTQASRAQAFAAIESALDRGRGAMKDRASGQAALFGAAEILRPTSGYPNVEAWDAAELLKRERTSLGFYLSGHPLDRYEREIARLTSTTTQSLDDMRDGTEVSLVGVVEGYRERPMKTGGRMAFFELEDKQGRVEVIVRGRTYAELEQKLDREAKSTLAASVFKEGEAVIVTGRVTIERRRDDEGGDDDVDETQLERKLVVKDVTALGEALRARAKSVRISLVQAMASGARMQSLKGALAEFPGKVPVQAVLTLPDGAEITVNLPAALRVDPDDALLTRIERIFGSKIAELR